VDVTKRYRKRPEYIEAVKVSENNLEAVARWCGGRVFEDAKASDPTDVARGIYMPTLEGVVAVRIGAYILKRVFDAQLDVMNASEFEKNYEQVGLRGDVVPPYSN